MAKRPIFVADPSGFPFVKEVLIEFDWYPGFSKSQAQKSIGSLHRAAAKRGISPILDISSKSPEPLGISLSAFNLMLRIEEKLPMTVECAFQGSKVFEKGGPYTDLYYALSREAKTDERLRNSGNLVAFNFLGEDFPIYPTTAFYDWLYITALWQSPKLAEELLGFRGFSDIAFNPKRSINCQARSAALFVALYQNGVVEQAVRDKNYYIGLIGNKHPEIPSAAEVAEQLSFFPSGA